MALAAGSAGQLLLVAVLAFFAVERLAELAVNRRNARRLRERSAVWERDDGFGLILLAQAALFGGLAVEATLAPWAAVGAWTWPLLGAALAAQVVRWWVIATLRERWSVRVVTVPGAPRVTTGPYRWTTHPNYAVVLAEAVVLPLAFLAWGTLLLALPLTAVALRRRIRREEAALRRAHPASAPGRAQ